MIESIFGFITADISGLLVQLLFAVMVLLMVFDRQKPPLLTGLLTGLALIVLGIGGSFEASAVAAVSIVNGFLWLVLAWQRYRQGS